MMKTCEARNGSYGCQRPEGHGGMFHAKTVQQRKGGRVYRRTAFWTDAYGEVKFSIPTWIG